MSGGVCHCRGKHLLYNAIVKSVVASQKVGPGSAVDFPLAEFCGHHKWSLTTVTWLNERMVVELFTV